MTQGEALGDRPELARTIGVELEASQDAFKSFHGSIAGVLGIPLTAAQAEFVRPEVEESRANLDLLRQFAGTLPHAGGNWWELEGAGYHDQGVYEFEPEDPLWQYFAKQLQANVLWIPAKNQHEITTLMPNYVIGRRATLPEDDEVSLLLLPAAGLDSGGKTSADYYPPSIVSVKKDDLHWRDSLVSRLLATEFTDGERNEMLNGNGRITVGSNSPGSIILADKYIGKSTADRVASRGVRSDMKRVQVLSTSVGVSSDILKLYDTAKAITLLGIAFRVDDKLRTIVEGASLSREQQLEKRVEALKARLTAVMVAAGLGQEDAWRQAMHDFPAI